MEYTTIVTVSSAEPAALKWIAPFAGCAMGEELMYEGKDVLIIYDNLTQHAQAYREVSLLLRRPPGREAYPGDIFFLHSRLLERAAKLSDEMGGGSLTALPVIETQAGDVSAYIPTNLISITDGQIYLQSGVVLPRHPAGRRRRYLGHRASAVRRRSKRCAPSPVRSSSISRSTANSRRSPSSPATSTRTTQQQLTRGEKITEVLKQPQFHPQPVEDQVAVHLRGDARLSRRRSRPPRLQEWVARVRRASCTRSTGDIPKRSLDERSSPTTTPKRSMRAIAEFNKSF